jgi:branched-chain amino acid transport system permease protein
MTRGAVRSLLGIVAFLAAMTILPTFIRSEFWLTFLILALYTASLGQAWNVLGGFGGQYSFGHAMFFGVGAYAAAVLQVRFGINPWVTLGAAFALGGATGAMVGALTFRYGLKGSYFALVTLAFAEVFRVLANTFEFTGAGVGMMIKLAPGAANFQFAEKTGFYFTILAIVAGGLMVAWWLKHSRFGAWLTAVRENEDAARALGVDVFRVKLGAITLSGAMMATGGVFYVQMFQYIDPPLAFGSGISVEALLVAIVGGMGSIFGPLIGAFTLALVNYTTTELIGKAPALSMALYGLLLIVMVTFLPNGLIGGLASLAARLGLRQRSGKDD